MEKKHGLPDMNINSTPSESMVDEACDESFPASDPLAWNLGLQSNSASNHHQNHIAFQLTHEHNLIKKVIQSIDILIKEISSHQKIDFQAIEQLKNFFQIFVEKSHHQKEEILYNVIHQQKKSPSPYLINDLIHEHKFGKELLSKLHGLSSEEKFNASEQTINHVVSLLKDIRHFYSTHIEKEEEYILPAVHQLDDKIQKSILSQFKKIQSQFDENKFSHLLNLKKNN